MLKTLFFTSVTFLAFSSVHVFAASESELASQNIAAIDKSLVKTEKLLANAKAKNNVSQVNCLLQKRNLVLGLLRAAQRAKEGIGLATINNETSTVKSYADKGNAYKKSALEVEQSLGECVTGLEKKEAELATLVYIRSDSEPEFGTKYDDSAWDWNTLPGSDRLPVIPPASPFR